MISRLLNGLAAVLGAGVFAQFPEFYQQYLQRLGGRLDQALIDMERLLNDATILGRTLEAYLEELLQSGTLAARQAARRELERVENADQLRSAYEALSQAGTLERPLVFFRHLDPDLAGEVLDVFVPALPVSPEGLVYAGFGMVLGLLLLAGGEHGGRGLMRHLQHRRRRMDDAERSDA